MIIHEHNSNFFSSILVDFDATKNAQNKHTTPLFLHAHIRSDKQSVKGKTHLVSLKGATENCERKQASQTMQVRQL